MEHGRTAGTALLSTPDRPTAIACQSDLLASGVVLAARELGLRVPEDVSVSGFDGLDLPWLAPDVLTTVVQPLAEKGAAVGHAVEDFLAGAGPSAELPVQPADRDHDGARARRQLRSLADDRLRLAQHPDARRRRPSGRSAPCRPRRRAHRRRRSPRWSPHPGPAPARDA